MTMTDPDAVGNTVLDENDVAEYLHQHPDFLARHPELLAALRIPHNPGSGAISLIERQVTVLRERNQRLESRLTELLQTARDNERVGARLLALGRGLLDADSLDSVIALVRDTLLSEFAADEVMIRLIDTEDGHHASRDPDRFVRPGDPAIAAFDDFLRRGEPVCGDVTPQQREALFGEAAGQSGSCALVPLRSGRALGLIGLASRDAGHFHAGMGTLFLAQLGELVSAGVAAHLDD